MTLVCPISVSEDSLPNKRARGFDTGSHSQYDRAIPNMGDTTTIDRESYVNKGSIETVQETRRPQGSGGSLEAGSRDASTFLVGF